MKNLDDKDIIEIQREVAGYFLKRGKNRQASLVIQLLNEWQAMKRVIHPAYNKRLQESKRAANMPASKEEPAETVRRIS